MRGRIRNGTKTRIQNSRMPEFRGNGFRERGLAVNAPNPPTPNSGVVGFVAASIPGCYRHIFLAILRRKTENAQNSLLAGLGDASVNHFSPYAAQGGVIFFLAIRVAATTRLQSNLRAI